jgi:DNA polymerase elongation subunit (family B)
MFGRTELGESVYIRVDGFPPHFYILLPDNWKNDLQTKCDYLIDVIKRKNSNLEDTLEKYEIVHRKKFYGFCGGKKWQFMRLVFKNKKGMMDTARMFENKICMFTSSNNRANIKEKFIKFDVYESNIDPYLRFMHIQDLQSCGWIKINKSNLIESSEPTTCTYAYNVNWFDVLPMNEKIGIAPFIVASFDLECKSWDGINFPVASDIRNPIIQIGISLSKYRSQDVYKRIMISLNTCDPIDGVEVHVCKREKELIEKFQEIMQREDPDIYTGYNIVNFDIPYLFERANHKDIKVNEKFFHLSKLKDRRCKMITKNLSSSALGDNKLNYIDAIGRIPIDLMKVVQRDFKLSSYKLDSVAENFFKDKVTKIEPFLTAEQIITNEIINENIEINEDNNYDDFIKNLSSYKVYSKNISILSKGNYIRFEKEGDVFITKYKIIEINHQDGWFVINSVNSFLLNGGKIFWGLVKDDIKPKDIFELYEKTSADRKLVAEYCVQDCVLVSKLMSKLEVLTNNISMASVCHVPLHFIFFRGQGIKSLSLVAKTCRKEGYLIPVMKKDSEKTDDNVGYEGATVFDPNIGFHRKPITVKDYNSLYPSSIISKNVSHETLLTSPEYDNLPGYIYYDVTYNNQDGSKTHCRFAKKVDEYLETNPAKSKFGIIPSILAFLLAERKAKKKEMNRETDPFKKTILDGTQNALKVTANSIYGQLGAPTSPIYFKHGAACTTSIGRTMLETGRDFVERDLTGILMGLYNCIKTNDEIEWENILNQKLKERDTNFEFKLKEFLIDCFDKFVMKPKVTYGDSVMPYTPVLVKLNGEIKMLSVMELGDIFISMGKQWEDYNLFKEIDTNEANRHAKERIILNDIDIMSYTNNGWSQMHQLIRHKCNKAIYRVLTHTGLVDVTEDHSLIKYDGSYIKPNQINENTLLMHHNLDINNEIALNNDINVIQTKEEAKVMGFFVGDGSCGTYSCQSGLKYSWALNNKTIDVLNTCIECLKVAEPNMQFKILDTIESSNVYKLVPVGNIKYMVQKYRNLFYDANKAKIIPNEILYASRKVREAFLEGYYMADGNRKENAKIGCLSIDTKNQTSAQHLYYLLKSLDYNVSINCIDDKPNIFRLGYTKKIFRKNPSQVKKYFKLHESNSYDGYVYDLTTTEGVFQAGIGNLIVKNTDSIFINFDFKDKNTGVDVYDKVTLYYCIELGKISSKFLKTLLPYPHNMEYEKTFYPFAQMAKKKYAGNKYEDDINSFKFSCMGVVLKRRDNAHIVKKIIGSMVDIMMNEIDIDKTIRTTKKLINELLKGNFDIHEFITSKTLRGTYKGTKMTTDNSGNAGDAGVWAWDDVNCQQAHILLAQRMAKRDPGNAPQLNDRIPFVAIETPLKKGVKLLQGNRIEHPEYILEKKLKVDYLFYLTNQIMNPAKQFLDLIMKPSEVDEIFRNFINREEDRRKGRQSLSKFGISKSGSNTNDTNIDIDMFINKQAKPSNTVASKKSELIKVFKEINGSGLKSTFVKLSRDEYLTMDTNIDSDDDNIKLICSENSDIEDEHNDE